MKRTLLLGALVTSVLLSGCQTVMQERENHANRTETLTNIVGNVWRIDAVWPGDYPTIRLAEHLQKRAKTFCDEKKMGMLPVRGATEEGAENGSKPTSGWLEFRCQQALNYRPEYKGIFGHFDPEELTDFSNIGK